MCKVQGSTRPESLQSMQGVRTWDPCILSSCSCCWSMLILAWSSKGVKGSQGRDAELFGVQQLALHEAVEGRLT